MSLKIGHFNTWAACLEATHCPHYFDYMRMQADNTDVLHLSEVHSCTDPTIPNYVNPEEAGHRKGPIHVRQLQMLKEILEPTHHVYFEPQMNGLHDLDASHPTIEYGNVTCVKIGVKHSIRGKMIYRKFNDLNTQNTGGLPAGKSAQSVLIQKDGFWYQSVSTHGHWDHNSKIDTPYRDEQFGNMMTFAQEHRKVHRFNSPEEVRLIVGGDFNLTSQCQVLEDIRKSPQFGEGGGVILNHEFQDGPNPLITRTDWYPPEKEYREANFVIVGQNVHVDYFTLDDQAPSDHVYITTIVQ